MYTPHTVTVYNVVRETDPATLKDVTNLYVTVLYGVFCEASKGVNVRKSGLEGADAVNLYIPFAVKAVDGFTGKPKTYTGPKDFFVASDRTNLWTLSYAGNGGETIFIKGKFVTDNEGVALSQDNCWAVTKVDAKDYGSAAMQHWEVGGA